MAVLHRPVIVLLVLLKVSNFASASTDELGTCNSSELSLLQLNRSTFKLSKTGADMENKEEGGRPEGKQQGEDYEEEATVTEDEVEAFLLQLEEGDGGDASEAEDMEEDASEEADKLRSAGRRRRKKEREDKEKRKRQTNSEGEKKEKKEEGDFVTKDELNKAVSKIKQEMKNEVKQIKSKIEDGGKKAEDSGKAEKGEETLPKVPATCPMKKRATAADMANVPRALILHFKKLGCEPLFPKDFKLPEGMPKDYKPEAITTENWFFPRPKVVNATRKDRRTGKTVPYQKKATSESRCERDCNSMVPQTRWYVQQTCECYKGPSLTEPCKGQAEGANCTFRASYPKGVKGTRAVSNRAYTYFSICVKQKDDSKPLWCPPHAKGPWLEAIAPLKKIPCGDNYCKKNEIRGEPCTQCDGRGSTYYDGYTMTLSKCGDVPRRDGSTYFGCLRGDPPGRGFGNPPATAFSTGVKGYN